jgi:hypothetical protein
MMPVPVSPESSSGGRLVSTDGRILPLAGARLIASARGGVAEVILEQSTSTSPPSRAATRTPSSAGSPPPRRPCA